MIARKDDSVSSLEERSPRERELSAAPQLLLFYTRANAIIGIKPTSPRPVFSTFPRSTCECLIATGKYRPPPSAESSIPDPRGRVYIHNDEVPRDIRYFFFAVLLQERRESPRSPCRPIQPGFLAKSTVASESFHERPASFPRSLLSRARRLEIPLINKTSQRFSRFLCASSVAPLCFLSLLPSCSLSLSLSSFHSRNFRRFSTSGRRPLRPP